MSRPGDDDWLPPGYESIMQQHARSEQQRQYQADQERRLEEFADDLEQQRIDEAIVQQGKEKREKLRTTIAVAALIIAVLSLALGTVNLIVNL